MRMRRVRKHAVAALVSQLLSVEERASSQPRPLSSDTVFARSNTNKTGEMQLTPDERHCRRLHFRTGVRVARAIQRVV